jgi:hypothetical protein
MLQRRKLMVISAIALVPLRPNPLHLKRRRSTVLPSRAQKLMDLRACHFDYDGNVYCEFLLSCADGSATPLSLCHFQSRLCFDPHVSLYLCLVKISPCISAMARSLTSRHAPYGFPFVFNFLGRGASLQPSVTMLSCPDVLLGHMVLRTTLLLSSFRLLSSSIVKQCFQLCSLANR